MDCDSSASTAISTLGKGHMIIVLERDDLGGVYCCCFRALLCEAREGGEASTLPPPPTRPLKLNNTCRVSKVEQG